MLWEGGIVSTTMLPVGLGSSVVAVAEGAADVSTGDEDGSDGRGVAFWASDGRGVAC